MNLHQKASEDPQVIFRRSQKSSVKIFRRSLKNLVRSSKDIKIILLKTLFEELLKILRK